MTRHEATIRTCPDCGARYERGRDGSPVTLPGHRWVVTDVGTDHATATLHAPTCPALPPPEHLTPITAED